MENIFKIGLLVLGFIALVYLFLRFLRSAYLY